MKLFCAMAVSSLAVLSAIAGDINYRVLPRLHEVDFENLPADATSCQDVDNPEGTLPNPLSWGGLVFSDPNCLATAFCSFPTCLPDVDDADSDSTSILLGNTSILLNAGGTIEFPAATKLVVLDVQGIGNNPFTLRVTDRRGRTYEVQDEGVLFSQALVRLSAPGGIQALEVLFVGGTGGPLAIAAVYYR